MKSKRVLIVEDEEILRAAYRKILLQEGFDVDEAANGKEALKKLSSYRPHLILLDILMPEMDGLEFLRTALLKTNAPDIHVIAFSNLSDQQKLDEMVALGVSKNILKSSLSPKQLVTTIRQLI